jgi:membrane protease YdiL (CAAX protease family)
MWAPGLAALFTRYFHGGTLRGLGWGRPRWRFAILAYFLPVVCGGIAYSLVWASGLGHLDGARFRAGVTQFSGRFGLDSAVAGTLLVIGLGFTLNCGAALGEEIGWRGFLTPALHQRLGFVKASFVTGCVWAMWHWPLIFAGGYDAGPSTPFPYQVLCFSVATIGESFAYAWLRLRSGSIWPAVVYHASHNLFVQAVFDPLTVDTPWTRWS